MTVPRPAAFDAATFQQALDANVRRPDGNPYAVFSQFREWKLWVDRLRDHVEANRRALGDHKADLDDHSARIGDLEGRVAAMEAQPTTRFP